MSAANASQQAAFSGFFITGTDTEVGKTWVTANIARALVDSGKSVTVRKPIASGCILQADGTLYSEDAHRLKAGANSQEAIHHICPYQFAPPISPQLAIQQAGLKLTINDLYDHCQPKISADGVLLIEGAGGFMSPLALDGLNADLACRLQFPIILVVANRLGCINHALLSAFAIQHYGLKLHSIIVNQTSPAGKNYSQGLSDFIDCPIHTHPYQATADIIGFSEFVQTQSLL